MSDLQEPKPFEKFGMAINELLRYGFGGALFIVAFTFVGSPEVSNIKKEASGVLVIFLAFALGAILHAASRLLIEFIFWPIRYLIVWGIAFVLENITGRGLWAEQNSSFHLLRRQFQVRYFDVLNAFRVVRDEFFEEKRQKWFRIEHSEIHLVYVATLVSGLTTIYVALNPFDSSGNFAPQNAPSVTVLGWLTAVLLFVAVTSDILLAQRECAYLRTLIELNEGVKTQIRKLLGAAGYLKDDLGA